MVLFFFFLAYFRLRVIYKRTFSGFVTIKPAQLAFDSKTGNIIYGHQRDIILYNIYVHRMLGGQIGTRIET